jgi:hypothetical protein
MVRYTGITLYQVDWQGKRQGNFALCEAEESGAPLKPARPVELPTILGLPLLREPHGNTADKHILCKVSLINYGKDQLHRQSRRRHPGKLAI